MTQQRNAEGRDPTGGPALRDCHVRAQCPAAGLPEADSDGETEPDGVASPEGVAEPDADSDGSVLGTAGISLGPHFLK